MTKNNLITTLFRPEVLALSAYHVADATGLIKLDAMENPYTWSDEVKREWLNVLKDCELNRYPDPEAKQLTATIKQVYGIKEEFSVLLGNGSDEIIQLLLMALTPNAHVLSTTPSFVMYKQISDSLGLNYHGVLLNTDFDLNKAAMLTAIAEYQPSVIFIAYPNNPSGNLFNEETILAIIEASNGLVILDEAYAPFANASFISRLGQYDNLLVMRTVSKLGLAGLRLGYLVGLPSILEELNKIRLPYNINILTQASANFALTYPQLFEPQTQAICDERARLLNELNALQGIQAFNSAANFILFKTPENKATAIFQAIKQQGVLIKNLSPQAGLLTDCLRVTVGTPDENTAFLVALKSAI
jgi:histidinol-phosphate aminotransferase